MIFWWVTTLLSRLSMFFPLFRFNCELVAEWLKQSASGSMLQMEVRVRLPCCCSSSCGAEFQAQNSCCTFYKFKRKLRLSQFLLFWYFFMRLEFIQRTQDWVHCFKSFNRVKSTQDEKARFIKGNKLKLTQVELFSFLFFKRVTHKLKQSFLVVH